MKRDSPSPTLSSRQRLVLEYDWQGRRIRTYIWGLDLSGTMQGAGGVGGMLMVIDHTGTTKRHYAAYDGNGNVMGLADSTTGDWSARYEYGPFGEPIRANGNLAYANPIRWSTKYTDGESGLVYYGYRSYNLSTGRWLNRDPIGERGGLNRYEFGVNNAVDHWDSLGLLVESPPLPKPPPTIPPEPIPTPRPPTIPKVRPAGPPAVAACIAAALLGWEIGTAIDAAQNHLVSDFWGEKFGDLIDRCRRIKCSYRHPTWMRCRPDATSDPQAATERDAPSVQGWSGPYVTAVYSGGAAHKWPGMGVTKSPNRLIAIVLFFYHRRRWTRLRRYVD